MLGNELPQQVFAFKLTEILNAEKRGWLIAINSNLDVKLWFGRLKFSYTALKALNLFVRRAWLARSQPIIRHVMHPQPTPGSKSKRL